MYALRKRAYCRQGRDEARSFVTFTFYGRLTSNNVVSRRVGRRTIANPQAVIDKASVFQLAYAAARECAWVKPPACAVTICAYNTRKDLSNCEKVIGDGMIGAAYDDDSTIIELHMTKARDFGGERYEVRVEPRAALEKPKKPCLARKRRHATLAL